MLENRFLGIQDICIGQFEHLMLVQAKSQLLKTFSYLNAQRKRWTRYMKIFFLLSVPLQNFYNNLPVVAYNFLCMRLNYKTI